MRFKAKWIIYFFQLILIIQFVLTSQYVLFFLLSGLCVVFSRNIGYKIIDTDKLIAVIKESFPKGKEEIDNVKTNNKSSGGVKIRW